jgi:hypothetical protein
MIFPEHAVSYPGRPFISVLNAAGTTQEIVNRGDFQAITGTMALKN